MARNIMPMPSPGNRFSEVPRADIPRSAIDRSHSHKTTFDGGYLIPVYYDNALPGDTFNVRMSAFARLATPIFPIMDNLHLESFFFAVPMRLVWNEWERFNGAQVDPGDSTDYVIPGLTGGAVTVNSIFNYFGLPIGADPDDNHISCLPFRAYNLIWNTWFRDQNLQDSLLQATGGSGPIAAGNFSLQRRGKRHDYFTSALPWPQKGDAVSLPLGEEAPVLGIGKIDQNYPFSSVSVYTADGLNPTFDDAATAQDDFYLEENPNDPGYPRIYADLADASAATINELRQAFQIQKLLERDARGGTRYTEIIRAHFGVTSPDARLQRPEYLGGGHAYVNISPIAQTSSTDATTPQGNLSAMGTASVQGHGFTKSFTEHSIIIGLVSVRADLSYQQGIHRSWSRRTRYDFYWPALAHIGEQAVLNKEIYVQGTSADDDVFGYQERYAEYRYKPSLVTGQFSSLAPTSLDAWHLAQDFGSLPVLNASFIEDNPPIDRVVAVPTEPHFLFDSFFKCRLARPMPLYGVPGLIDHF